MGYVEDQLEWVRENSLREGDRVLVAFSAENGVPGWAHSWGTRRPKCVGKILTVTCTPTVIAPNWGIKLRTKEILGKNNEHSWFPFTCLIKVKEEK